MQAKEISTKFWKALEASDTMAMRGICEENCMFVHIGGNANLDEEMSFFEKKIFQPTTIIIHDMKEYIHGDVHIVLSDVDSGLLLGNEPTTHHFTTTEVYQKHNEELKLIQFTYTALVH